jgi:transcription elongation factor Elf1
MASQMEQQGITCPKCDSEDVVFSKKRQHYVCRDCRHEFSIEIKISKRRIFLSYGHDEYAALAEQLKKDLQERGHEVWFDLDRLKPGGDWERYIEEGIEWVSEFPGRGSLCSHDYTPFSTSFRWLLSQRDCQRPIGHFGV